MTVTHSSISHSLISYNINKPMANSKYEYVKAFERCPTLLPNTFIVVRVDGRGFHKSVSYLASVESMRFQLRVSGSLQNIALRNPMIDVRWI